MTRGSRPLRIGVALGGGSARGYAHIGALKSLERHGLAPQVIAGTSFGAVIGALYAAGRSPDALADLANGVRRRELLSAVWDAGFRQAALLKGDRLEVYFDALLDGRTFADLRCELVVVTTDAASGERVLLRSGSVARALRATVALPGLLSPVQVDGRRLMDGGLGSPVPLETLGGEGVDLAIGIGTGLEGDHSAPIRLTRRVLATPWGRSLRRHLCAQAGEHPVRVLGRSLGYVVASWEPQGRAEDALHVQVTPSIGWLTFHRAEAAIAAGEAAVEAFLPRLLEASRRCRP
ncbi:MAG: patatin-like phospholipase family protein [Deinococcota bacterium]|jgi:NTE family protein|nr:patatin-like phospholipase family protein [Deinococcota bacterium]